MICLNCGEEFEKDIIDKSDVVCPKCKKTDLAKGSVKAIRRKEDSVTVRCECGSNDITLTRKENNDGLIKTDYKCRKCSNEFEIYQIESKIIKKRR